MATAARFRSSADGWRGVIGESFTPEYAAAVGRCVIEATTVDGNTPSVLVTHDGRQAGVQSASAVVAAVMAAGVRQVRLVPHLPTPTASAAVRRGAADVALIVTASHNPARWNGLKVKVPPGCGLPRSTEQAVETLLAERSTGGWPPASAGTVTPDEALGRRWLDGHIEQVLSHLPAPPAQRTVVVDGLGGVAGEPVARLCEQLGWNVTRLGCAIDPSFGGLVPDPSLPASRSRAAARVTGGADLGIVLDGDGDRIFVIDERGRTVQPHELLALLLELRWRSERAAGTGRLAVTVSTGTSVRTVATTHGWQVWELPIGFKHLSPLLASGQVDAAGGSVGDLAFVEYGVDRDPFVAVMLLSRLLDETGVPIGELVDDLRNRTGHRHWFESRIPGGGDEAVLRAVGSAALATTGQLDAISDITVVDGVKFWLPDGQWLLLRNSSTEGGLRLYGELFATDGTASTVAHTVEAVRRALVPALS